MIFCTLNQFFLLHIDGKYGSATAPFFKKTGISTASATQTKSIVAVGKQDFIPNNEKSCDKHFGERNKWAKNFTTTCYIKRTRVKDDDMNDAGKIILQLCFDV